MTITPNTDILGTYQIGDPVFVNSSASDYHLTQSSAAIDKAVETGVMTDLDGQPRPNPVTGIPDLGADEFYTGCTIITNVSISGPSNGAADIPLIFTTEVTPSNATPNILYTWSPEPDAGQGTNLTTYSFHSDGAHTINLTVQNCGGSHTASKSITIGSSPEHIVYLPLVAK